MISQLITDVSVKFADVIVKLVPAVRAVTETATGVVIVPSDSTAKNILLLAVTFVVLTTATPNTSVAMPSLHSIPL